MMVPLKRLMLATMLATASLAAAEQVRLEVGLAMLQLGDEVGVTVLVDDAEPFANWQSFVHFDASRLQLLRQEAGDFSTFIADARGLAAINASGEVRSGGFSLVGDNTGGSGRLAVLTFLCISAGEASVATVAKSASEPFGSVLQTAAGSERVAVDEQTHTLQIGAGEPEIVIARAGIMLPNGGTDAIAPQAVDQAVVLTYTIENAGSAELSLGAPGTVSALNNCTALVSTAPAATVVAGATTSVQMTITPGAVGNWSCHYSLSTNDSDENPSSWQITGTATALLPPDLPAIVVSRAGTTITTSDEIAPAPVSDAIDLHYLIRNTGTAELTITAPGSFSVLTNCMATISTAPAPTVAAESETALVLSIQPLAVGAWSCVYSLATNDPDDNPASWHISGVAEELSALPALAVSRDGQAIVEGSIDTLSTVAVVAEPLLVNYTLTNVGSATLSLESPGVISAETNCSVVVSTAPATSLAVDATGEVVLTVTPAAAGAWSCTYTLNNNGSSDGSFHWQLSGTAEAKVRPTVSLMVTQAQAVELPQRPGAFTLHRSGSTEAALSVGLATAGSASSADYAAFANPAVIPVGASELILTIQPVADGIEEGMETLQLTVVPDVAYSVAAGAGSAELTIVDTDVSAGLESFSLTGSSAHTNSIEANVGVEQDGAMWQSEAVPLSAEGATVSVTASGRGGSTTATVRIEPAMTPVDN